MMSHIYKEFDGLSEEEREQLFGGKSSSSHHMMLMEEEDLEYGADQPVPEFEEDNDDDEEDGEDGEGGKSGKKKARPVPIIRVRRGIIGHCVLRLFCDFWY